MDLARENARLMAQVDAMSGDEQVLREAEPWRDATPEERLAATWSLCADVPSFEALWPDDVRARADEPEPLPADAIEILARLRAHSPR